ncbi:MAG: sigma 54-interacting transcriptional regulator [Magnetococcales bacterium]|nr:sigma 54-interacting transcriptional regulator [Magnetococcales bacterium]
MSASVLVVDDDELIQDMTSIILSRFGHATVIASSLEQATEALQQQTFDLVIADLRLPDGSGLQLLAEIRQRCPRTYVILITGFPDVETVREALREGAFDYLIKPIMPTELSHVVGLALEHKQLRDERAIMDNRMEAVFRGVDDAIVVLDKNGRILQINDAATHILKIDSASIHHLLQDEADWFFALMEPLLQQVQAAKDDHRTVRTIAVTKAGQERIFSCSASPFLDPADDALGVILVVRDESRLVMLERETQIRQGWQKMVGSSRVMREVYELIERLADVDSTVLITGETGTGKELVARALHDTSHRRHQPFVAVNCAALPSGLLESELFGHVRGAFTGAIRDKMGRFKMADGGTLFLDEIGDISLAMQVRLLRVLQTKVFEAVGDDKPIQVDVRVVTATHRNLPEQVQKGLFREDLYYRLAVVAVHLPPLRERKGDIPLLIDHFVAKLNAHLKRATKGVSDEVLQVLMEHPWPGNVRELEHVLEHAMVVARQPVLTYANLPPNLRVRVAPASGRPLSAGKTTHRGRPLKNGEPAGEGPDRETILRTLAESRWQMQAVAGKLGISRSTLWRRMKAMGLDQAQA